MFITSSVSREKLWYQSKLRLSESTQAPATWRQRYWPSWNLVNVACLQKDVTPWRVFKEHLEGPSLYPKNTWRCWLQENVMTIANAILATPSKESSLILPEARRNLFPHKIFPIFFHNLWQKFHLGLVAAVSHSQVLAPNPALKLSHPCSGSRICEVGWGKFKLGR